MSPQITLSGNKSEAIYPLAPPQGTQFSVALQDASTLSPSFSLADSRESL